MHSRYRLRLAGRRLIAMGAFARAAKASTDACMRLLTGSKQKRRPKKKLPVGNLTALAEDIVISQVEGGGGMSICPGGATAHVENEFGE